MSLCLCVVVNVDVSLVGCVCVGEWVCVSKLRFFTKVIVCCRDYWVLMKVLYVYMSAECFWVLLM